MVGAFDFAPAIPLLPLASFLVVLTLGYLAPRMLPRGGALPGIIALLGSLALSLWVLLAVRTGAYANEVLYTWVTGDGTLSLHFGMLLDPLSSLMLVVVSLVALLVFVHSLGYMNDEDEPGLPRYYAGLSLFAFSMLAFTLADNLLMAFAFFELVGLCSWWLIGHWFREPGPPSAAKKAFLVTRFGDYFFLVGTVAVLVTFGTARFAGDPSFPAMAEAALAGEATVMTPGVSAQTWFTVIGLLVLGGVIGKSAQFPLHTWLPDAMEG
ncbi:MAG: proton-conducting transporter membrane subunit, partial [Halobacteriales archaeon]